MPVPNALLTASLPAKRAAILGEGSACCWQYLISSGRRNLFKNFSPHREWTRPMRATSIMSMPVPKIICFDTLS